MREREENNVLFLWFELLDEVLPVDFSILRANKFLCFKPVCLSQFDLVILTTCKFNIPNDTGLKFSKWGLKKKKTPDINRNDLPKLTKLGSIRARTSIQDFEISIQIFIIADCLVRHIWSFKKSNWKLAITLREKLFVCFANMSAHVHELFVYWISKDLS